MAPKAMIAKMTALKETTAKNRASKTGDMTSLLFPALMLTASAGAIGGVAVQRKKKGNKRENSKK